MDIQKDTETLTTPSSVTTLCVTMSKLLIHVVVKFQCFRENIDQKYYVNAKIQLRDFGTGREVSDPVAKKVKDFFGFAAMTNWVI